MKHMSTKLAAALAAATFAAGCGGGGGGEAEPPPPPRTVNAAPTISKVADQSIDEGGATSTLAFTIGDTQTAPDTLTVSVASSDGNLVPNDGIELSGTGANRTLTIFPAFEHSGTATMTLTVRDAEGAQASSSFALTVTPLLRAQFSGWFRSTVLPRELEANPVGEPAEDGQILPQVEEINRIKIQDDTAANPAAYDDLIPAEDPET